MSANAKTFKQTLSGDPVYDKITLPQVVTRLSFKSKNLDQALKVKINSVQEMLIPVGNGYDSERVDWVNPVVEVNGNGEIDGEYHF